jgi:hypothetical protein
MNLDGTEVQLHSFITPTADGSDQSGSTEDEHFLSMAETEARIIRPVA